MHIYFGVHSTFILLAWPLSQGATKISSSRVQCCGKVILKWDSRTKWRLGYWLPIQSGLQSTFHPSPAVAISKSPTFSEVLFHHLQNGGIISIWCQYVNREGPYASWVMGERPLSLWATTTQACRYPPHFTAMLLGLLTIIPSIRLPNTSVYFLFVDSATLEPRMVYHLPKVRKL